MSSWRMSILGVNPVSGGRPPRDSIIRGVRAVRAGIFVREFERVWMLVALVVLKVRKAEVVIRIYVSSAKIVRAGLN